LTTSCIQYFLYWTILVLDMYGTYNSQLMLHTASVNNTCNQTMVVLCHRISPRPILAVIDLPWQSVNAWYCQQQQNHVSKLGTVEWLHRLVINYFILHMDVMLQSMVREQRRKKWQQQNNAFVLSRTTPASDTWNVKDVK